MARTHFRQWWRAAAVRRRGDTDCDSYGSSGVAWRGVVRHGRYWWTIGGGSLLFIFSLDAHVDFGALIAGNGHGGIVVMAVREEFMGLVEAAGLTW